MNPIAIDKGVRLSVYTKPPAVTTRDWVTSSEPSLLALITSAVTVVLAVLLAKYSPKGGHHSFGSVAVLEAGENHKALRRIDFRRHPWIIP